EAVDGPGGDLVAEPLESRPGQDVAAAAVVHEVLFGLASRAIGGDPPLQCLELAGDRVLLLLLFPPDPGIERHAEMVLDHGWSNSPGPGSEGWDGGRVITAGSRPIQGPGDDRDQRLVCTRDELILEASESEVASDGRADGPLLC